MTQYGTWSPYVGSNSILLAVVLVIVTGVLMYLAIRLHHPIEVKRPGKFIGIALLFTSLSRGGLKFCDACVITYNEAVEIYTVPFGGNIFDIRGLGVVWLCVSGSSHTSCS
jgi:hypothetical protein